MAAANKLIVRYLPAAEADLSEIYGWVLRESPTRAAGFLERIDKRLGSLSTHPRLGRIPRIAYLQQAGYRVLMLDSYLVFYVIQERVVEIHRVIHGSRGLDGIV